IADARRAVGAGVRLAILVGLMATLLVFATPLLMDVVGVDAEVLHEARPYIYLRAIGIVPFLVTVAFRSFLASHHKTRPLVVAVIIGNIANAILDYFLIFPLGMGVLGAALATTFVQLMTVVLYLAATRSLYDDPAPPSTTADLREVLRYGGPVGGQIFAEVCIFGDATEIAAHLGELDAAAHSIALNIASFTFSFSVGVASATSVLVGHAVGAGDLRLARSRGLLGIRIGLSVMACFAAAFLLIPATIAHAFTNDSAVIAATVPLLYIAALFQLSDGTQSIGAGALRGLGRTRETLWANLVGHYAIALPLIFFLGFRLGLGIVGVWWALSVGLTATGVYLVILFLRGSRVPDPPPSSDSRLPGAGPTLQA
ncbi:MAG: MATE family efflux transporter, partial [Kofleriaceae bacterium]